jgi:hypothetical protein
MSTRGVGFLLILTVTIALGALAQDYRFDGLIATERDTGRVVEHQMRDLDQSVAALQTAQQAAVATGQTAADWLARAATLKGEIETTIANMRAATADAETIVALDAAADALKAFKKTDTQVRASLQQEDRLRASDLIFLDQARAITQIHESLNAARARQRQVAAGNALQLERLRLGVTGVAMLFVLAVALYFGRAVTIVTAKAEPSTAQMLRELPPPVKAGAAPVPGVPAIVTPGPIAPAAAGAAQIHAATSQNQTQRPTHLAAAAELCVDLAKVLDSHDVPALLERTVSVLDAKGIVLWAIDADGARLRASLSHGYSDKVLAKLRPLQIDGDNVTSLAYRSLQPQTMNGATPADHAALAIPLVTGTGCVGVMAVELRHNRPHSDLLPVARIIGAQFSTLIAVPDDTAHKTANG